MADLYALLGFSINDFINSDGYSISYCSFDDDTIINVLGTGTLLSKINAFQLIPAIGLEPLRNHWGDRYDIDTCLPFGLHLTPLSI